MGRVGDKVDPGEDNMITCHNDSFLIRGNRLVRAPKFSTVTIGISGSVGAISMITVATYGVTSGDDSAQASSLGRH